MTENPALTPEFTKKKFDFVAGNLCLDYCNTVGGKRGAIAREYLGSYSAFILWCEQAGLINKTKGRALMEHGAKHPTEAARVFARAVALREAIYRIFLDLSADKRPSKVDLATLNSELALALGRLRVWAINDVFRWEWTSRGEALDDPLGPLAQSAADLLISQGQSCHVGQCQGETCGWLFIDSSKNHSRRWCDMRDCGNRAKVRRHRRKHDDELPADEKPAK